MKLIKRMSVTQLYWILIFICILFFILFAIIENTGQNNETFPLLFLILAFLFLGLAGVPIIVRQETPMGFLRIEGWGAIISGIIVLALGLVPSIYLFVLLLTRYSQ